MEKQFKKVISFFIVILIFLNIGVGIYAEIMTPAEENEIVDSIEEGREIQKNADKEIPSEENEETEDPKEVEKEPSIEEKDDKKDDKKVEDKPSVKEKKNEKPSDVIEERSKESESEEDLEEKEVEDIKDIEKVESKPSDIKFGHFKDYNGVILGDHYGSGGDTEGRIAVRGNSDTVGFSYAGAYSGAPNIIGEYLYDISIPTVMLGGQLKYDRPPPIEKGSIVITEDGDPAGRYNETSIFTDGKKIILEKSVIDGEINRLEREGKDLMNCFSGITEDVIGQDLKLGPDNGASIEPEQVGESLVYKHSGNTFEIISPRFPKIEENERIIIYSDAKTVNFKSGSIFYNGNQVKTNEPNDSVMHHLSPRVTWIFPYATKVNMKAYGVVGSVFAPEAHVDTKGGGINGQLLTKNLTQKGGFELHSFVQLPCPEIISVSVKKIWKDENGKDITKEIEKNKSVTINLLADGKQVATVDLSKANDWTHIFKELDIKKSDGTEIEYTIKEVEVDSYTSTITGSAKDGFIVTNTKKPDMPKINIDIDKTWYGQMGKSVTINLLADGEQVDTVELSSANSWEHEFKNLNKLDSAGKEIVYEVEEEEVDGYRTIINGNMESGFKVINIQKVKIPVEKIWKGNALEKVTINLLADDKQVDTVELSESNEWKYIFSDLDIEKLNGTEIKYTVEEVEVDNYTSTITGSAKDGFTVTNTQKSGSLEITKVDGNDNTVLEGAEFKLTRDEEGTDIINIEDTKLIDLATDGQGKILIKDLHIGTYYLHETKAPISEDGKPYRLLTKPIEVKMTEAGVVKEITVKNFKSGWELPSTGGMGTIIFYGLGITLMLLAGYMLTKRKTDA